VVGAVVGKAVTPAAIQISPLMMGIVAGSAVLCMLVATAVAWRATRIRPLAVLRYE
jgi:ABC-type lipoprotein release transport system permease subunit